MALKAIVARVPLPFTPFPGSGGTNKAPQDTVPSALSKFGGGKSVS